MAENNAPEDGSIASFKVLDSSVKAQTVPVGTKLLELNLPDMVTADIYHVTDEVMDEDADELILDEDDMTEAEEDSIASPSEAGQNKDHSTQDPLGDDNGKHVTKVTRSAEEISVTWDSSPVYDGDVEGKYLFTADVGSYPLSEGIKLPQITVTVGKNTAGEPIPAVKNISRWSFVDDDYLNEGALPLTGVSMDYQADFDTVLLMLPTQILAEIDAGEYTTTQQEASHMETVDIISWNCPLYQEDEQGNWPVSGEYTFTAELESGCLCNPLPSVKVLLGGASPFTINDRFAVNGLLYKELGPDTVQLIGYEGDEPEGELHIPSQVVKPENSRTYKVVSIGSLAFNSCHKLTGSLVIPNTVTEIGESAFLFCDGFNGTLTLPDRLTSIGSSAFERCKNFNGTLVLPPSLTQIGQRAFSECTGFTGNLVIPEQITIISADTFSYCTNIDGLTLPAGLREIHARAFTILSNARGSVILPDGITLIGTSAFSGINSDAEFHCSNEAVAKLLLDSISYISASRIKVNGMPYTAPTISDEQDYSFQVTGADTVKIIRPRTTLNGVVNIPEKVTINNHEYTVTAIGNNAFRAFLQITGIIIPDTVTEIGDGAFHSCRGLKGTLKLPNNLITIGDNAFRECMGLTGDLIIPDTVTRIGNHAFSECYSLNGSLTLPSGLTEINESAFAYCRNLTGSLNLPSGLTQIKSSAFEDCSSFTGPLNLPPSVTHVDERAFYSCSNLEGAFLGKNITTIGPNAFDSSLPLTTNSPQIQLLINRYSNREKPVDTYWDGGEDIPDGALVTVSQNLTLEHDRRMGIEAEGTVEPGAVLTVNSMLTMDGTLFVDGTLIINGTLNGSGKLAISRNGRVIGNVSGILVEYPDDIADAKNLIETYAYSIPQYTATDAEAVKVWLSQKLATIPDFSATGVSIGEITVTSFVPAKSTTNGSFTFDVLLAKGNSRETATGSGIINVVYRSSSSGDDSYTNPDILHGDWIQTDTGLWMFRQTSGVYAKNRWGLIGGLWYYFNAEGHMLTGWQQLGGVWYYLNTASDAGSTEGIHAGVKEGAMKTGWHYDSQYQAWFWFDAGGAMATGKKEIDGKWYYFNSENDGFGGSLYTGRRTPDGYYADENGVWDGQ